MILRRSSRWYRPYYVGIGNNNYYLDSIIIYDENGIITQCSGWFEKIDDNGIRQDIEYIDLYIQKEDIMLKRKEDFNINKGFLISKGKDYNELKGVLYLHKDIINLKFIKYVKEYNSIYAIYNGYVNDNVIYFSNNIKHLGNHLYGLQGEFNNIIKDISCYDLTKESLNKYIKDLKKVGNEIIKEKEYIDSYSVEDYTKEMGL